MHVIVCVDDKYGLAFNRRRQSRDKVQIEKMLETVGKNKLIVSSYTAKLFEKLPDNLTVCDDPAVAANTDDYCFIETDGSMPPAKEINSLILYRWNRTYPADVKFDVNILSAKKLVSSREFAGNSHEKITEEIYR